MTNAVHSAEEAPMSLPDLSHIHDFLKCRTPAAWIDAALGSLDILLIDHAANEMKAAQSAMTLMARYPQDIDLLNKMSRLAREELVHFEQVLKILKRRGEKYRPLKAGRYAAELSKMIRRDPNGQRIDSLIVGAVIEARSCERFAALAPYLTADLSKFYLSLLKSESRHYQDYLHLASTWAEEDELDARCQAFLSLEQELITMPDRLLRFHSGVPQ